jgi:hypothetical protein
LNLLGQSHCSRLQGTLQVHVHNLITEIGALFNKSDQPVFNLQENVGALLDSLMQNTFSLDGETLATTSGQFGELEKKGPCEDLRLGRVRRQVDRFNVKNVAAGI